MVGAVFVYLQLIHLLGMMTLCPLLVYLLLFGGYLFDTLQRIAHGHLEVYEGPPIGHSGLGLAVRAIMVYVLDYVLIGGLIWLVAGSLYGERTQAAYHAVLFDSPAIYLICLLLMPAQWIVLVQAHSVVDAMSPTRIGATLAACGSRYVLILLFQYLLNVSALEVISLLASWLPLPLLALVLSLLLTGSWLVSAAIIGYVCLERHGELNIPLSAQMAQKVAARRKGAPRQAEPVDPLADVFAQAGVLIGSGDLRGAQRLLYGALDRHWGHPGLHEQYFKLALANGDQGDALIMARQYVTTLVHGEQSSQALDWYLRCAELAPRFLPANPGDLLLLAEAADRRGACAVALALVERLLAEDARHPQAAQALALKDRLAPAGGVA